MSPAPVGRWLLIAAALGAIAAVTGAIAVMGSPARQREMHLDMRRVRDLRRIDNAVDMYFLRHNRLPADLATLARQPGIRLPIVDPATAASYAYLATGERSYRLCAVFATDTAASQADGVFEAETRWSHGAGKHCYDLRAETRDRD